VETDRSHVLVVEDKLSVLKLMSTVLGERYQVSTCSTGEEAVAILGATSLDVVLTDIRMPGLSGFEVLRTARRRSSGPAVVMMTAYANVVDAVTAIRQGAFDYVAKPLDADEIALVVARAVEHQRETAAATHLPRLVPIRQAANDAAAEERSFRSAVEKARDQASRSYLERLMETFHGNVTQAAKRAGMTRESLHRVLRRYGVQVDRSLEAPSPGPDKAV
jgi:DNA-binding NtrC family response regulator